MKYRKLHEYSETEKALMENIFEYGAKLSGDVFEDPMHVEIATYEYEKNIYYFRIVNGKVVSFRKLN